MKELLSAIQSRLQNDSVLSYVNDADVFITPDEDVIPYEADFPALGIKDGAIERIIEETGVWEVRYMVNVAVFVLLTESDTSIMGSASPPVKGILDIVMDIHQSLNDNLLGVSGMESASPVRETESATLGYEDLMLQSKVVTYEYVQLKERP